MLHDPNTLPHQTMPDAQPEPPTSEHRVAVATTVPVAAGASETKTLAVTGSGGAAPSGPRQPPNLDRLGNGIAELSARIQVATYELLCYLRVCRATDYAA